MPVTARNILKQWFETGKKPTQGQFANLIDSFIHKSEDTISIAGVNGLAAALANKASVTQITTILTALGALENLETSDKTSIVAAINELKGLIGNVGGLEPEVFESDTLVSLSGGKHWFKWADGDLAPTAGKSSIEVMIMGSKEEIAPSANIHLGVNSFAINQKLGIDISVNYNYSINSLGATLVNFKLERSRDNVNWVELINSPTPPASPYLDNDLNAGVINNTPIYYRLTIEDSVGLMSAPMTKQALFAYRSFLGYRSTPPESIADIIALGNGAVNDDKARTFNNVTAGEDLFTFYAYRAAAGNLNALIMDGSAPILGAVSTIGDITGVDEFGGAVTYRIVKSNATQAFNNNTLAFG